tara:strand:+ start:5156 stop:5629 length:474 start_codon:yes stop_codon:yes gene_type:complete
MAKRKFSAVKSSGALEQKSVADLLEIYRGLAGDPPEFETKDELVRACILKLAHTTPTGRRRTLSKAVNVETEPPNRKEWFFDPTRLEIKHPRPNTKRESLVAMLRRGSTFPEIQRTFNWTYQQAFSQMRAVNTKNGYGFVEKDKVLTIFTYEEGPPI